MNCYNGEKFLKEAIDSVFNQSYLNWEIIFYDNSSSDSSGDIAKSYGSKIKYYKSSKTTPLGEARNAAIKLATGNFISFLDCDDLYLPHKLESQVKLMEQGSYGMSYGSALIIDEQGNEVKGSLVKNNSGFIFDKLLSHYEINMQSVMIRSAFLKENNLNFPTHFEYGPDYDLFMELASRCEIGVVKDPIVKTRIHSGALSKKTYHRVHIELRETLSRILARDPRIKEMYPKEVSKALDKLKFYESINFINNKDLVSARNIIKKLAFKRFEYALIFILLYLPLPRKLLMKFLGR